MYMYMYMYTTYAAATACAGPLPRPHFRSTLRCARRPEGAYPVHVRHRRGVPAADVLIECFRIVKRLRANHTRRSTPHRVRADRACHAMPTPRKRRATMQRVAAYNHATECASSHGAVASQNASHTQPSLLDVFCADAGEETGRHQGGCHFV